MIEAISILVFIATCGPLLFPDEIGKLKRATKAAAKLTREQMSASACTNDGVLVKGYRSKEEARCNRVRLGIGTVIFLPDGTNITVEKGLNDVKSDDGWWYAWTSF